MLKRIASLAATSALALGGVMVGAAPASAAVPVPHPHPGHHRGWSWPGWSSGYGWTRPAVTLVGVGAGECTCGETYTVIAPSGRLLIAHTPVAAAKVAAAVGGTVKVTAAASPCL